MTAKTSSLESIVRGHFSKHPDASRRLRQVAQAIGVRPRDYGKLKRILEGLSREGSDPASGQARTATGPKHRMAKGVLQVKGRGLGFVTLEDGAEVFVVYEDLGSALSGDVVRVELYGRPMGGRSEGRIVEVVERKRDLFVGTFHLRNGMGEVLADERAMRVSIHIAPDAQNAAKDGEKVVARVLRWGSRGLAPEGKIVDVIGFPDARGTDFECVVWTFGLPRKFPKAAEAEASNLPADIPASEIARRLDLRDRVIFTIDPASAKDFDDAISIRELVGGGAEVCVHIADVSHYAREGSAIDREALRRGTSVYLMKHVVPMLPERLSNDLCSLRPGQDRLTMTVIMNVSNGGEVVDCRIVESVIRSRRRLTYREAQRLIESGEGEFGVVLRQMWDVAEVLLKRRRANGSIDFEIPEPVFKLDENDMPIDVLRSERLKSHRLIEEFMLLANKTVARHIQVERAGERLPFLYRVHPQPDPGEVENLLSMLRLLGLSYAAPRPVRSEDYRNILQMVAGVPEKDLIEKIALRTMTKARYDTEAIGHFGLAFPEYTHFTSPIRRYPDLMVHRLLKLYSGSISMVQKVRLRRRLSKVAGESSARELVAVRAERELARIKEVKFLRDHVGETFDGLISGVTTFGFFVELTSFPVEGLVAMRSLKDDYYVYRREGHELIGRRTGRRFRLGDAVSVRVEAVNVAHREIDFILVSEAFGRR